MSLSRYRFLPVPIRCFYRGATASSSSSDLFFYANADVETRSAANFKEGQCQLGRRRGPRPARPHSAGIMPNLAHNTGPGRHGHLDSTRAELAAAFMDTDSELMNVDMGNCV